jgi:hypothetical protein
MREVNAIRIVAILAMLAASSAYGQPVGVTLKLMTFDPASPGREQYEDRNLGDRLITAAISNAWEQQRQTAEDAVRTALSGPNRLASGMTAREISVTLGEPGSPRLTVLDRVRGRLELTVPANAVTLTTTHPLSQGPSMDPRLRIGFDLKLVLEFQVVAKAPYVQAASVFVQPAAVSVQALNASAALGMSIDQVLSSLGGARTIGERIVGGMEQSKLNITQRFNSHLATNAGLLALPPGYLFNGGRVESTRVVIAAYRAIQPSSVDFMVSASWPKTLGELMADCRPLGAAAQYQSGPPSLHGDAPPYASALIVGVNPRYSVNEEFRCHVVVRAPAGVPLVLSWARPIPVGLAAAKNAYLKTTLNAEPAGWANPVVARASGATYLLKLSQGVGATAAGKQLNARASARISPIDPVAKQLQESARVTPADTVSLNPQPLPPGAGTPATKAALNPQPLPPRSSAPANRTTLNPQPLPPSDPRTGALRDALERRALPSTLQNAPPEAPRTALPSR